MKETFGLINAKNAKPPSLKPSPKDFVWPPQDHDDKIAQKFAASLQELLPKRDWKHTDLARALYGGIGPHESPRNVGATRRWVVAEHPIPNENTASYIAQVLDVPLARLMEPEGKFDPVPPMIRPRSDSPRFAGKITVKVKKKGKKAGLTPSGKDREKQRAYNAAYRARKKAGKPAGVMSYYMRKKLEKLKLKGKHKDTRKAKPSSNGAGNGAAWVLADGVSPPDYQIMSAEEHPGHVEFKMTAVLPLDRAMAILHMLKTGEATE